MSEQERGRTSRKVKWWASTTAQLLAITVLSGLIGGVLASHYDGATAERFIWFLVVANIVFSWYTGMFFPIIKGGRLNAQ